MGSMIAYSTIAAIGETNIHAVNVSNLGLECNVKGAHLHRNDRDVYRRIVLIIMMVIVVVIDS